MMGILDGPPPPDTNFAPTFLGVTGVFTLLAIGLCGARLYSRIRPKFLLRIDDYLILIGTFLCTVNFGISAASGSHGWGHHTAYVTPKNIVLVFKLNFVTQVLWILAIALVRLSIASSLLRLSPDRAWKWTLWTIIGIQILTYIGHMIFQFFNCMPLRANWEPVYDIRCWPRKYVLIFGWTANSILVAIDVILALLPIHLIRTLHRSIREKILICCLMAMGLVAAAIAAYRMGISDKTFAGDLLSSTVMMSMWCMLEVLLGIIAACLAPLKAPAERMLHQFGLLASRVNMSKPSFVLSLPERQHTPNSDNSDLVDSVHSDRLARKERKGMKGGVTTVEVDHRVP
ncbi:hypothetical protein BU24DRAFT_423226 [Aaosphaeria arxii CBS 175.79]|uniref:Rhodopsin domain-containing protein n=1 Tax=Aaosphaeria arxii CBS 175.79 TaxID=1450172 RepID=A0A6A5XN79_9PLEO|nr:uncharacterized protein BU24DRAFT_423226 [Aaosphaeria arxii CBS 175.79]KAF2014200.1 hypothetical protein BU24DRAFT_423226 [Aaosphaeria arxii CBS 175.79]